MLTLHTKKAPAQDKGFWTKLVTKGYAGKGPLKQPMLENWDGQRGKFIRTKQQRWGIKKDIESEKEREKRRVKNVRQIVRGAGR